MNSRTPSLVSLDSLVELFYEAPEELGQFEAVLPSQMPEIPRKLLAHQMHMTVTVEQFHEDQVDVTVLQSRMDGPRYSREILLTTREKETVVQYGIVRLNLDFLSHDVAQMIRSESAPLGRILIENKVLREVKLENLYRILPGERLKQLLNLPEGSLCYGRTAMIYCDAAPAIELLEVVPVS